MSGTKSPHQDRVEQFMKLANQIVPRFPTIPSEEIRHFRAKMILEEALETIAGLGYAVIEDGVSGKHGRLTLMPSGEPDLIEIVDGCADVSVVTIGTLSACGVADAAVLFAVDMNNLAKFGPGSYRREDGKWMKPPGHRPPDIAAILKEQVAS
jgi:predicted HAD superfamily Cof-like phosphohydrolase